MKVMNEVKAVVALWIIAIVVMVGSLAYDYVNFHANYDYANGYENTMVVKAVESYEDMINCFAENNYFNEA